MVKISRQASDEQSALADDARSLSAPHAEGKHSQSGKGRAHADSG